MLSCSAMVQEVQGLDDGLGILKDKRYGLLSIDTLMCFTASNPIGANHQCSIILS